MAQHDEWRLHHSDRELLRLRLVAKRSIAFALALACVVVLSGCSPSDEPPGGSEGVADYAEFDAVFADWATQYVDCAREYGADARLNDQGSIENAVGEGRPVREGLDADCIDRVGSPPEPPPLNDEFLAGMFELFVEQADCLRAAGYVISEPPSREEWVENYDGYSWNPLIDVFDAGADVQAADGKCPQPGPREAEQRGAAL